MNNRSIIKRTSPQIIAKAFAKIIRKEETDYNYLKSIFRHLRAELKIEVVSTAKKLPYVPTNEEIEKYYKAVWQTRNMQDMVIIKTLLYTGIRVSELININLDNIDFNLYQIHINNGKGKKDRIVPFPNLFKETLALHVEMMRKRGASYLFESSWQRKYSDRGIRKILARYGKKAGIKRSISPHKLRHFLFTWLKSQGMDDAFIQPFSGHTTRKSLEIYSKLSIVNAQKEYNKVINEFPI